MARERPSSEGPIARRPPPSPRVGTVTARLDSAGARRRRASRTDLFGQAGGRPADRRLFTPAWAASATPRHPVGDHGDSTGLLPSALGALPAMTAAVSASTLSAALLDAARRGADPEPVRSTASTSPWRPARSTTRARRHTRRPSASPPCSASGRRQTATGSGCTASTRGTASGPWRCWAATTAIAPSATRWHVGGPKSSRMRWRPPAASATPCAAPMQWHAHPQGRAVAALPLLQAEVGTGPGRVAGPGRAATGLPGARSHAGPGRAHRRHGPWPPGEPTSLRIDCPRLPEMPLHALDTFPGKRSAEFDLAEPAGPGPARGAVDTVADLLVQGYRPGALARFGLDAGPSPSATPICRVVTLCAWGPAGPWAERRGFDSVVQCPTGIALAEGTEGRPGTLPAQVLDHATGLPGRRGRPARAGSRCTVENRPVRCSSHWRRRRTGCSVPGRAPPSHRGAPTSTPTASSSPAPSPRSTSSAPRPPGATSNRSGGSPPTSEPTRRNSP